jgi:hypothetical protein
MVSAQPISARVEISMLHGELREIANLPSNIHTLEPRRHRTSEHTAELDAIRQESIAMNTAFERALRRIVDEHVHILEMNDLGGNPSFEVWNLHSNRAIGALQALVTQGRAAEWPRLLYLRETVLQQYLEILQVYYQNGLGQDITEEYIRDAVVRAQAVHDMDTGQRVYWEQVLHLIRGLRVVPENGQHNLRILTLVVSLISQKVATDVFDGPPESFSIGLWNQHSNRAIETTERLVTHERDADWLRLLTLRKFFLKQYLMVLIRLGEGYDVTEADIGGAMDRVQALFHMEGARWDQVSHLIQSLRVGPGNFQLLRLVIVRVQELLSR